MDVSGVPRELGNPTLIMKGWWGCRVGIAYMCAPEWLKKTLNLVCINDTKRVIIYSST